MLILGIESSCDDTAAAVIEAPRRELASTVNTQHDLHAAFGGVVPEIASRAHAERVTRVIERAVHEAGIGLDDLDAIAVTHRPGLVGALLVGVSAAQALAWRLDIPLIGVHHIEAHATSARAEYEDLEYPFVSLVASGGHTALYACRSPEEIERVAGTVDDAAGECFDKVAVLLGLEQPGGPAISRLAEGGDPKAIRFPRSRVKGSPLDCSFSGLKTAVLYFLKGAGGQRGEADRPDLGVSYADVAASFQRAAVDVLVDRTLAVAAKEQAGTIALGGGVAANRELRRLVQERAPEGTRVFIPSPALCTDNAVMIAVRGAELLAAGKRDDLGLEVLATGD